MSHTEVDKLLIRPTHGDRAGAGGDSGQVPLKAPVQADQFSGHAPTTGNQPPTPSLGIGG
jgi:hypothetical protein